MNLLKNLLHGVTSKHNARRMMAVLLSVLMTSSIALSGCSSRDEASASKEESSSTESSTASSAVETVAQPEVELLASATRYAEVDTTQLAGLIKKKKVEREEKKVTNAPPAAGDIAGWKKTNSDVVGWITIANTNINYPLIYHKNSNYYTARGYQKEYSKNGVIWFDGDTRFNTKGEISSNNAVIYGHNWTNCWRPVRIGDNNQDVMFGQLAAYDDATFAKNNQYIRVATEGGDHLYQVFSVFYPHETESQYWYAQPAKGTFEKARKASIHDFGVSVSDSDKVITLSTCTRIMGQTSKYRFLVMAKKVS